MTISRAKPAGWGVGDKLTSAEQNQVDLNTTYALDKRTGQTDTLSSLVSLAVGGRVVVLSQAGTDANGSYDIDDGQIIKSASLTTAARTYTITDTNAQSGDVVEVYARTSSTYGLSVVNGGPGGGTLAVLGPHGVGQSLHAAFIFDGTNWIPFQGYLPGLVVETFTSTTTWDCPLWVKSVILIGCGGGGGGAGGRDGSTSNDEWAGGGGGGGGAPPCIMFGSPTPGTTYDVEIGAGGAGGSAGLDGASGGVTNINASGTYLCYFEGAGGGNAHTSSYGASGDVIYALGGTPHGGSGTILMGWNFGASTPSGEIRFPAGSSPFTVSQFAIRRGPGEGGAGRISGAGQTGVAQQCIGQWSGSTPGGGSGGSAGADSGSTRGGGGGGGGGGGAWGSGGAGGGGSAGSSGANGTAGSAAAANSGGGGGGGGGAGAGAFPGTGGAGGNGGSGRLVIIYGRS